jgi:hypothetical protein
VKKTLDKEALRREKMLWKSIKKALKVRPARTCRK